MVAVFIPQQTEVSVFTTNKTCKERPNVAAG